MRGNNKRKLVPKPMLSEMLDKFRLGVPIPRLIRQYDIEVSRPHLRKLLFIYMDILDEKFHKNDRQALHDAIFPEWLDNANTITWQPDDWTYKGKFPYGEWIRK